MEEPIPEEQVLEEVVVETEEEKQADLTINEAVDGFFDFIGSVIGNFASNIAPLGAGIMPAYITWIHIIQVLGFPPWVAWCGAAVVEFMGLGAGKETMVVWNQRRQYKDEKNKMPIWAPMTSVIWYMLIVILFNILLEIKVTDPSLTWFSELIRVAAIALFATLAIPGYMLVAARDLRKQWLQERSIEKAKMRKARALKKAQREEPKPQEHFNLRGAIQDYLISNNKKPSEIARPIDLADEMGITDPKLRNHFRKYLGQLRSKEAAGGWPY